MTDATKGEIINKAPKTPRSTTFGAIGQVLRYHALRGTPRPLLQ